MSAAMDTACPSVADAVLSFIDWAYDSLYVDGQAIHYEQLLDKKIEDLKLTMEKATSYLEEQREIVTWKHQELEAGTQSKEAKIREEINAHNRTKEQLNEKDQITGGLELEVKRHYARPRRQKSRSRGKEKLNT
ncbi:MAG: hypothetical protein Q9221_008998 [Calogaya cf. arnoldii]